MSSDPVTSTTNGFSVEQCTACPALCEARSRIVNGVGPSAADVVIVGEAPGQTEDETGEPFVGRSGQILDEALEQAGLVREDVRITNCVRCRPPDNRDPHVAELDACRSHLLAELVDVQPSVIVPVGRVPVGQLLPELGKVSEHAGETHPLAGVDRLDATVVVSVHPAATLYNRSLRPTFFETFETVAALAKRR